MVRLLQYLTHYTELSSPHQSHTRCQIELMTQQDPEEEQV